jgi:signal transduction histidine kinase
MTETAHILVVDDDDGGRYLKVRILRKRGYEVSEASSGIAAIEFCCCSAPDLVLLDTRLPDINGIEVCRRIKQAHPGIAVLQTSAAITTSQDRALALDGGADGFLVEPMEPEELIATAKALLRMRGAEQELRILNEGLELAVAARMRELTEANRRLDVEIGERRKAEDVLWHTQKLEVVGQLTGGIAHDFNNLLAVIVGAMELVRRALESRDELPRARLLRLLQVSETATGRATKLTQQLLAFARRSELKVDIVTLDEVLVACEPFLRRALGEANSLVLSSATELWACKIDPAQFEAAILNLVVNARDAMPDGGGLLEIATSNVTVSATDASEVPPGSYAMVRVTDTGTGMTPDVVNRVFEPFFTTKEVGKGTGLGLSQVYGFIKQSGGHVTIETRPGVGTTFRLYLPRCAEIEQAASKAHDLISGPAPTGHETVLIVEDNAEVRELTVETLSDLGYRVLSAADGPAALRIVQSEEPIDLLFSDVVMPGGINGFDLVHEARTIRGGLKALVTSGFANVQREGTDRMNIPLLAKPYRRSDLAQRIRMTLDQV